MLTYYIQGVGVCVCGLVYSLRICLLVLLALKIPCFFLFIFFIYYLVMASTFSNVFLLLFVHYRSFKKIAPKNPHAENIVYKYICI